MEFKLKDQEVPDGTILLAGITFDSMPSKTWTYALMKAGGRWYTSGTGKSPQDAGWGAINRWLNRENTRVEWISAVTETEVIWQNQNADGSWPGPLRFAPPMNVEPATGSLDPVDPDGPGSVPWDQSPDDLLAEMDQ